MGAWVSRAQSIGKNRTGEKCMKIPRFLGKKIQKFRKTAVGPKMVPKYPKIAKMAK